MCKCAKHLHLTHDSDYTWPRSTYLWSLWIDFSHTCLIRNMFRTRTPGVKICNTSKSFEATKIFKQYKYPPYEVCEKSCLRMDISLGFRSRVPENKDDNHVQLIVDTEIMLTNQAQVKSFLSVCADLGGYFGLTSAYSLLDSFKSLLLCATFLKSFIKQ